MNEKVEIVEQSWEAAQRRMAAKRTIYRCLGCLSVVAFDGPGWPVDVTCGACGSYEWERMGVVEQDRLVSYSEKSVCDTSCTFARGPKCICKCLGFNHSSRLVVTVRTDRGKATVTPLNPEKALADATEWKAAVAKFEDAVATCEDWQSLLGRYNRRVWLSAEDFDRFLKYRRVLRAGEKARTMKSQNGRMKAVTKATAAFFMENPAATTLPGLDALGKPEPAPARQVVEASDLDGLPACQRCGRNDAWTKIGEDRDREGDLVAMLYQCNSGSLADGRTPPYCGATLAVVND